MITGKKIGVISLGCDKNRVDTEKMLAKLRERHELTNDIAQAEIIIINTCAFLASSRKESIEEVIGAAEYKKNGACEKIIVTGCLPQRFLSDIKDELIEADAFLGVSDYDKILDVIDNVYDGERVCAVGEVKLETGTARVVTTDGHAYLKIADGCSNRCTYCLIPSIRGKYRSVPTDRLITEVSAMGDVDELILVAQDVTKYGEDLEPKTNLVTLVRKLTALKNVRGVRLLYCYPENVTDELIHEMAVNAKIIRYIDVPFQHADDKVLKRMNRKGRGEEYLALIKKLKERVPGIAVRSTFITGFPGEGEEEFNRLLEFIDKAELFNAGFFKYSREEGTPAYLLDGQVDEKTKTCRVKKLYSAQKKVVGRLLKSLRGKTFKVKAEGFDEDRLVYYGRAYFNAPDIDGKIYFFSAEEVSFGTYYDVKITARDGYDLIGERI